MPNPKIEFELDPRLPLSVRNTALDFTDRWHGFESDVYKSIAALTSTAWTITKIKAKFQSTPTSEPETTEARATLQLNASPTWRLQDYMAGMIRELIAANTRTKIRRQTKKPFDETIFHFIADIYSRQLLVDLMPQSNPDFRPSVAHFVSILLPNKYPQANKEKLLEKAPRLQEEASEILKEFPSDSGRYYEAFLQLKTRLNEDFAGLLAPNL